MNRDLVIGIDASTSAVKAVAWDRSGAAAGEGRAPLALSNPQPGWFEQEPDDWWAATASALRRLSAAVDPRRIACLAIANQRETFGVFDGDGRSLRPGMVWLDDRAGDQQRRFGDSFGAGRVHAISGKPLDIIPCLYRLIWLREHEPDAFGRAAWFADVHSYLCFRLTGQWVTSTASADPMGLLDMERLDWSDDILDAAGIPRAKLPALLRPGAFVGEVLDAAAAATGLAPGLPVFAGGGDGQCAGTAVAALEPGRAYVNLGTAVVSGTYSDHYVYDRGFRTETAVADKGYILETCLRSGTFVVDWLAREMFGVADGDRAVVLAVLEAEAAASQLGAGGVVVLPYWQGCMTPHWDSGARGVIAGLSGSTKRGDVFRALLEGIALDLAYAASRATGASRVDVGHYVAIGGGAGSDLWMQILADACDRPVRRSTAHEASSLGAAMAAAKGAGWFPTIAAAAAAMAGRTVRTFEPCPDAARRYAELRGIHADLWPAIAAWNTRLRAFEASSAAST